MTTIVVGVLCFVVLVCLLVYDRHFDKKWNKAMKEIKDKLNG